jgi:hypothetical protein
VRWKNAEAAGRLEDRRRREAEAPRLAATVPTLEKLRLECSERSANIVRPEHTHTRHVIVQSAPALFVLPCHDSRCKDGGHDITQAILTALKTKQERFQGEDACPGVIGTASCARVLDYVGVATYQAQ